MRKLMRFTLMFVVAMLMVGLFIGSSCDKSSDSKGSDSLVGTWRLLSMTMTDGATTITVTPATMGVTMILHVYEDGTAQMITTYADGSSDVETGTWSASDDHLYVTGMDFDGQVTYDLSGDTLTITMVETDGTDTLTTTLVFEAV